jgi:hypothetical protein
METMKKPMKPFLLIFLMLVFALSLMAQSAIKDYNGNILPYVGSSWISQTVSCTADTVWKEIEIPTGTYEILARPTANIKLAADTLYAAADNYEMTLQDTTAYVALPVHNMTVMWIRRAAAGTAASLNMLFKKW